MSNVPTKIEIQRATEDVEHIKSLHAASSNELQSVKKELKAIQSSLSSVETDLSTLEFYENNPDWKPVIAFGAPAIWFGIGFIPTLWLFDSLIVALIFALTFLSTSILWIRRTIRPKNELLAARIPLQEQLVILRERQLPLESRNSELTAELKSAKNNLARLKQEYTDHINSIEYQRSQRRKQLLAVNWRALRSVEFESYLREVFRALDYQVATTSVTGDQGVDLVVARGQFKIAIQVKGYYNSVGNTAIQEAFAGMAHYGCNACAVVTNSRFTKNARILANSTRCCLIDEELFPDFVLGKIDLISTVPAAEPQAR